MPFKINISNKGKTLKVEIESEALVGRKIGENIRGESISSDLKGYILQITGTSDLAGFPGKKDVEGPALKKVLLTKGFGMHKKPRKEGKKPVQTPKGLKLKKSVRGNTISTSTIQINTIVKKQGDRPFEELLPKKETSTKETTQKTETQKKEQPKEEQKSENTPEEKNRETKEQEIKETETQEKSQETP